MFLSFFSQQRPKPKTTEKPTEPEKPTKRGSQTKPSVPDEPIACGIGDPDFAALPEPTAKELEMCEVLENVDPDDSDLLDADKTAYDKEAVSNV